MTAPRSGAAARGPLRLTPEEGRVLGALVEKELTTPQGYPLTDNALLAACNQTTSRDPVVSYDTAVLRPAVRSLRDRALLRTVHRTGERSDKHRHELVAALGLSPAEVALLGLLLLRGSQTLAELRARAERWHPFAGVDEVEQAMAGLLTRDEPLAVRLERQPGRKESRYAQVLVEDGVAGEGGVEGGVEGGRVVEDGGRVDVDADAGGGARVDVEGPVEGEVLADAGGGRPSLAGGPAEAPDHHTHDLVDEVRSLRAEVATLRAEVAALHAQLSALTDLSTD